MNLQFLYESNKDRLEKQGGRKYLNCARMDFYMDGNDIPVFSIPCNSKASSILEVTNLLRKNGSLDLIQVLTILKCISLDNYNREYLSSAFIKVGDSWYKLPKDTDSRANTGNMNKAPLRPVNTNYYGRDCTTYGQCPACGYGVQDGMGRTDHSCGRCKQPLNWN